jgi:hypothetical protein
MTMPDTSAFDRILATLATTTGFAPRGNNGSRMARCPAHDDRAPRLSVTKRSDRVLLNCQAGCDTDNVLAALRLTRQDLFDHPKQANDRPRKVAEYSYADEEGRVLYVIERLEPGRDGARKTFLTRYPNGKGDRRVVYRLTAVMAAACDGRTIYFVEGEKDADRLAALGYVATTSVHGAGKWRHEYAEPFDGGTVVIIADRDEPGLAHAHTVAASLRQVGCTVRIMQSAAVAKGADVSDHLDAGYGVEDLVPLVDDTTADPRAERGADVVTPDAMEVPDTIAELDEESGNTEAPSWAPVDLTDILAGTYVPEAPNLMARTDGFCLLYLGRCHSFHGESESGKSLVVQAQAADVLTSGGAVLYIDYESDAPAVVGRLRELGASVDAIRARFHYVHPDVSPFSRDAETEAWLTLLSNTYVLAVIDGVTDALGTNGVKTNDNDEIASWCRRIARPIARRTGAAVVLIDHVTKDAESRGRFALGGQAKMNALDGAAYVVEVDEPLGRGLRGAVKLRVAKDRPGGVRGRCGTFRKVDRTQEAARVVIDSTTPDQIRVTVEPPASVSPTGEGAPRWRPTMLMEKVSRFLQGVGHASMNQVRKNVSGKDAAIEEAAAVLVDEGFVSESTGPRNARILSHVSLYTQFGDPSVPHTATSAPESTSARPRPDLGPAEVQRLRPTHPFPVGVGRGQPTSPEDPQLPTSARPKSGTPDSATETCGRCGFAFDTIGHAANCEDN